VGSRRRRRGRGGSEVRGEASGDTGGAAAANPWGARGGKEASAANRSGSDLRDTDLRETDLGETDFRDTVRSETDRREPNGRDRDSRDSLPMVEITPLPIDFSASPMAEELVTVEVPARRRRPSRGSVAATAVATAVVETPTLPAVETAAPAQEPDDSEEPRRRRRRSSASD
jgi:hypothetical protein